MESKFFTEQRIRSLAAAAGIVSLLALSSCAPVAPHQRGRLAHPTMEGGAFGSKAAGHVYAIGEGAMGGEVGAAAGCGCN